MTEGMISVITVVYNNKDNFIKTFENVKSQSYKNIEYIVIDGGSIDGTLEVIKSNAQFIKKWISEKDKGIYDAMNKGINLADGEYVCFMNAGDIFHNEETISNIFKVCDDADVYYGDTELVDESGKSWGNRQLKKTPENLKWQDMIDGMVVTHQSLIIRKSLIQLYDLKYIHCADIDWTIKVLKKAERICNTNMIITTFLMGGYSRKNTIKSLIERFGILSKHFGVFRVIINHFKLAYIFIVHIIKNRRIL